MSQVTKRGPVEPRLNITPLIDVVFLLIVFFMIVNNIVTDEVPPVQLPELEEPETRIPDGERRVIVNIIPEDEFGVTKLPGGKVVRDERTGPGHSRAKVLMRSGIARAVSIGNKEFELDVEGQAQEFQTFMADAIAKRTEAKGEAPMIMLRADAALNYNAVLPVMNLMQAAMAEALDPEIAAGTPIHLVAYMDE